MKIREEDCVCFSLINWCFSLHLDNTQEINNLKVAWHFLLRFSIFDFSISVLHFYSQVIVLTQWTCSYQSPNALQERSIVEAILILKGTISFLYSVNKSLKMQHFLGNILKTRSPFMALKLASNILQMGKILNMNKKWTDLHNELFCSSMGKLREFSESCKIMFPLCFNAPEKYKAINLIWRKWY